MSDDRADRLRATTITELLVDVALVDRQAARRTQRLTVSPGASGDESGVNQTGIS